MNNYELLDNDRYATHLDALHNLATRFNMPISIATGYINLNGLHSLANIAQQNNLETRLMIGAYPQNDQFNTTPENISPQDRFQQSVQSLRRERNFDAFPAARRAKLTRIHQFIQSPLSKVKRYHQRFLHGKAYIFSQLQNGAKGAAIVSSANLTAAGLQSNLELGMVQYQPNVVDMALEWYQNLWIEATDFKTELLDLLLPDIPETDPRTIYLRALLEYYGDLDDNQDEPETNQSRKLTDFQIDGYLRAKRIIEQYNGVLYADGVGMGKTEIGVEFVRQFMHQQRQHVLIITPAQLRDNLWRNRLAQENLRTQIISYQQLANDRQLSNDNTHTRVLDLPKDMYSLVVIDEAHAYRNSNNTWHAALDRLMSGTPKKLLLLTATPVNNTLWDLHNLFLLFARHDNAFAKAPLRIPSLRQFFFHSGASQPERISEAKLFPLIDALTVRRDRRFIQQNYRHERFQDGTEVKFPKPELHERRYALEHAFPGIVSQISQILNPDNVGLNAKALTMARYRPSAYLIQGDGTDRANEAYIAGFMRSMLLKRFESSWYSALQTVKRILNDINTILQAIHQQGIVPSADILKKITADAEDGTIFQDDLMQTIADQAKITPAQHFRDDFITDLQKDQQLLQQMRNRLEALKDQPDPKLTALKSIMQQTPAHKVAIFSTFRDTVEYLQQAIHKDPEIIAQRKCSIVTGADADPEARARAVERFCPAAESEAENNSQATEDEVDVLISTDILSEGQNLQKAQAVISFDMPWNPQRVVQRNGRIIRLKSPHHTAYLYTLLPQEGELEEMLQLEAALQLKIQAANASIGMENPVLQNSESKSRIYSDLKNFTIQLAQGDPDLIDERVEQSRISAAFAGEKFRTELKRAHNEGELKTIKELPWGIGAAFISKSPAVKQPAVFLACRTRNNERYWRMISKSGQILEITELEMLLRIDPDDNPGCSIPNDWDMDKLFNIVAKSIVDENNQLADPAVLQANIPASQRWAIEILRLPQAPQGREYDNADSALSVGRNRRVILALSALRREYEEPKPSGITVNDCAHRIVSLVQEYGLEPVEPPKPIKPIDINDIGVVCYQILIPNTQNL